MLEEFFGRKVVIVPEVVVVDGSYDDMKYGTPARARLWRAIYPLVNEDPVLTEEAVHLGTAYIGNQSLSPETLLHRARIRFKLASLKVPNRTIHFHDA